MEQADECVRRYMIRFWLGEQRAADIIDAVEGTATFATQRLFCLLCVKSAED
jgi:hypothetical protein